MFHVHVPIPVPAGRTFAGGLVHLEREEIEREPRAYEEHGGAVERVICHVAGEGFDIVALPASDTPLLQRAISGSVSRYVVEHAPCSVLLLRR